MFAAVHGGTKPTETIHKIEQSISPRCRMQPTTILNDEQPDRLHTPELDLFSGGDGELLLTVTYAVAVLFASLDVWTGYKRDAIVCVPIIF